MSDQGFWYFVMNPCLFFLSALSPLEHFCTVVRYYLQVRQSEVKRWLKTCCGVLKTPGLENVQGRAGEYFLWDLPESYERREVGSAVNACSAEWDYLSELMASCSHRRRLKVWLYMATNWLVMRYSITSLDSWRRCWRNFQPMVLIMCETLLVVL